MDGLVVGLAIVALVMAVLAILFNVVFFVIQSRQANIMTKDNAAFAEKMASLLGELRGQTSFIGELLQLQFDKVLGVALGDKVSVEYEQTASIEGTETAGIGNAEHLAAIFDAHDLEVFQAIYKGGSIEELSKSNEWREYVSEIMYALVKVGFWTAKGLIAVDEEGKPKLTKLGCYVYKIAKEKSPNS